MSTIEISYIDPLKYGNPENAVKKFAKEIDRRQIKLEGVIGEGWCSLPYIQYMVKMLWLKYL